LLIEDTSPAVDLTAYFLKEICPGTAFWPFNLALVGLVLQRRGEGSHKTIGCPLIFKSKHVMYLSDVEKVSVRWFAARQGRRKKSNSNLCYAPRDD